MIEKFDLIHFGDGSAGVVQLLSESLFTLCKKAGLSSNANMEAPLHGGHAEAINASINFYFISD